MKNSFKKCLIVSFIIHQVLSVFQIATVVQGWPYSPSSQASYFNSQTSINALLQIQPTKQAIQKLGILDSSVITVHINLTSSNSQLVHSKRNLDGTQSYILYNGLEYGVILSNCDQFLIPGLSANKVIFGQNENQIFYSVNDAAGAKIFFIDQSNVTTQIGTEVYPQVIDLKIQGNLLYAISSLSGILYNKNIYSLSTSPPSSLGNTTSNPYVELSSHFNIFYSATQIKVQGLDGSLITTLSSANIQTAKPLDEISIIIQYTNKTLSQYHVFENIVMHEFTETELLSFEVYVSGNIVVLADYSLKRLKKMAINQNYQCLSPPCTCITGYTLSGSECLANNYTPITITPFNAPPTILNILSPTQICLDPVLPSENNTNSNNTTNSSNLNNTNITNTPPSNELNQKESIQVANDPQETLNEQEWIDELSRMMGNVESLAYLPTIFKYSVPLFLFVEDIMLYQFHYGVNYTSFMILCMKETNILKRFQLNPQFIKLLEFEITVDTGVEYFNQKYISAIKLSQEDKGGVKISDLYFPLVIKGLIYPTIPLNLTVFLFLSLIQIALRKIFTQKNTLLYDFAIGLYNRLRIWAFFPLIIDPFILPICFSSFNHLTVFFSFQFQNKMYLVLTVLVLFVLICFGICFHILIYTISPSACESLLSCTKFKRSSFILEAVLIYVSKIIHSLIHSNVIWGHNNKLICLICFDLLLFFFICFFRRNFMNKLIFIAFTLYRAAFVFLNAVLLYKSQNPELSDSQTYEQIIFYILLTLISLAILKMLLCLASQVYLLIKYLIKKKGSLVPNEGESKDRPGKNQKAVPFKKLLNIKPIKKAESLNPNTVSESKVENDIQLRTISADKPSFIFQTPNVSFVSNNGVEKKNIFFDEVEVIKKLKPIRPVKNRNIPKGNAKVEIENEKKLDML